ncbi:phosphate:Na+ symporter [Xylanibacter ruminicola]|uniref:Phosphate:Na+ symporter n=1 Tax=Xylanibacter ruminicola TaxID=839 RepID=A0A1H3ZRE9_XYLRU|nr:phosphate:Na+ symporter [Xylanibacter ruminicola]
MTLEIVLQLLGSLALLIYGMKTMSDALQKMAGSGLRHILGRMTTNRFTGMLTGTFVTCAVQSSSATTVMTVSFVSAGLLTLAQAISVIMGANIGTTLTAWIMSLGYNLNLSVVVFPAFLVGMVLIYKKRHRYAGEFLFGLAFLFWSLVMLSGAGKAMDLQHNAQVVSFFSSFDTSSYLTIFIFLIAGTLITCIVQSSAAVMAITILLCSTGVLPIYMGIALVMGENIGTTATANLAALGAGIEARRAALAHLLFNMFGVVWVLIVFYPFVDLVCSIVGYNPATGSQTALLPVVLALFHTCFNVLNTALLIGFIPQMERVVCRLLPDRQLTKPNATLHFIDGGVMATPEISVMQAQKEIIHFAERMQRMFGMTRTLTDEKDKKEFERQYERIERYETIADNMEIEIATYLEQVSNDHLSDATKDKIRMMFRQIGELESIGDACFKMARTIKNLRENREDFTPAQYARLRDMQHLVNEALTQMMVVLNGRRENLTIDASRDIETDINTMRDSIKAQTLSDVNSHAYSYTLGTIYTDIVTDCEKLGDYVMNVVEARLGKRYQNYNGLKMNVDRRTVTIDGQPISLTRTEFDLLYQLLAHRNHVLSRQQLMDTVWADVIVTERTVNVHVTRLRKKLGLYAQNIVSRQGLGYVFEG